MKTPFFTERKKKPGVHKEAWEINNVTTYPFLQQTVQNVKDEGKKSLTDWVDHMSYGGQLAGSS